VLIRKETSSESCQGRAPFQQHRDASCHQVFFSCKARCRRKFTPFWQKHWLVSFLVGLRTYHHPCTLVLSRVRVIQEEYALLWDMIVWVILSKNVHNEHGSDFERLWSYDRLKLGIEGNDYWQWTEENNKPAQYVIHLKYKCKVNFVKLPSIWIDLCLKLVFENVTAGRNTGCRSVVNCASCSLRLPLTHSDAVCGLQNATKQCISRYHLHTGLCYTNHLYSRSVPLNFKHSLTRTDKL